MIRKLHLWVFVCVILGLSAPAVAQSDPPPDEAHIDNEAPEPKTGDDKTGGDPVVLSTGNFVVKETDLHIPGRGGLDVDIVRSYRNGTAINSALGPKWDLNWFKRIVVHFSNCGTFPTLMYYYDGETRNDVIEQNAWTGVWETALGSFSKISFFDPPPANVFNPASIQMRMADGTIYTFGVPSKSLWVGGCTTSYWLSSVQDRKGNTISLHYQTVGTNPNFFSRLDHITDTYGRDITFAYASTAPTARLVSITDSTGRVVQYGHDTLERLNSVTTPVVDDALSTSLGNAFPAGKTKQYQYMTDDTASPQRFNITRLIDPRGYTYLENTYSAPSVGAGEGRVIAQTVGGTNDSGVAAGGKYLFFYDMHPTPILHGEGHDDWNYFWRERGRTLLVSPNGNVTLTYFDGGFGDFLTYEFTGRLNPDDPQVAAASIDDLVSLNLTDDESATDPDQNRLESNAPSYTEPLWGVDTYAIITRRYRDFHGLITEVIGPESHFRYTYDNDYNIIPIGPFATTTPDRFQHGNLLKVEQFTYDEGDPSDPIVTLFSYEPLFNQMRAIVDPRGNDPDFVPQNDSMPSASLNSPQRYMTRFFFDYQELDWNNNNIQNLVDVWAIDENQGHQFGVIGWIVPEMPNEDNLADLNGDGTTSTVRGHTVQRRDPSAHVPVDISTPGLSFTWQDRVLKYVYNAASQLKAEIDAEGNQTDYWYYASSPPNGGSAGPDGGGFLAERHLPEDVEVRYEYDVLGRTTRSIDGRGFATERAYNALDQIVQRTDADGNTVANLFDGNDNIVEQRAANRVPELSASTGLPTGVTLTLAEIKSYFKFDVLDKLVEQDVQGGVGNRLVTRYRYDKEGNRVLTLSPEFVAGNDASNVESNTFDELGRPFVSAKGGLGGLFRDASYINQAHSAVLAELGTSVVDLPSGEIAETYDEYNLHGELITHHDAEFKIWEYSYDGFNRKTFEVWAGAFGSPTRLVIKYTLDPAGNAISTEYRQANNQLLAAVHRRFDEASRAYQTDRDFFATGSGVALVEGPLVPGDGKVNQRASFDKKGRVVQTIDDNKFSWFTYFDGLDRKSIVSDHPDVLGMAQYGVQYTYDKDSNLILTEEGERRASDGALVYSRKWNFYDKLGRAVAEANNARHTDRYLYDSRSNLRFHSDAVSTDLSPLLPSLDTYGEHTNLPNLPINGHGNVTVYEVDDADRRVAQRRFGAFAGGQIATSQTFDKNGRLKTEVDDKNNTTTYAYDSLDRLEKTTFGDVTVLEVLQFDRRGNVKELRDQNGSEVLFNYNDVGDLTQATIYPGTGVAGAQGEIETYQYDGLRRLLSAADGDSTVTRFYDSLSNVVREDVTHGGVTRTTTSRHDGAGNVTDLTLPGGRIIQRIHDSRNRLSIVRSEGIDVARYSYIGLGRVQTKQLYAVGSGGTPMATETTVYDLARRKRDVKHVRTQDLVTIDHHTCTYDREGNKLTRKDELSQVLNTYGYDGVFRLISAQRTVVGQPGHALERTTTYTFDDVGNRQQVLIGGQTLNYTMNAADSPVNQYTNTPPGKWFHDENGNFIHLKPPGPIVQQPGGGTNQTLLDYDYRDRLVEMWNAATWKLSQFKYDALGRRLQKSVDGVVTRYYYVGWQDCEEQDSSGATLATYVYGRELDEVLSMRRAGTNYVYHADELGNVMELTNGATGAVVESYDYEDYGAPLNGTTLAAMWGGSAVGNPFLFNARRYDSSCRMYYYRNRYLDPASGRFVSRDPIGIWGDAANLGNGYTYCGNNPWSSTDPMGLDKTGECTCCEGKGAEGGCECCNCLPGEKPPPDPLEDDPPTDPPAPPPPEPPPPETPKNPPDDPTPPPPKKPGDDPNAPPRGNDPELPFTNPDGTPNPNHPFNQKLDSEARKAGYDNYSDFAEKNGWPSAQEVFDRVNDFWDGPNPGGALFNSSISSGGISPSAYEQLRNAAGETGAHLMDGTNEMFQARRDWDTNQQRQRQYTERVAQQKAAQREAQRREAERARWRRMLRR
ncbi:MAG: RHS repeat-associated core domain-containing protein [Planctomycetota bacterium]